MASGLILLSPSTQAEPNPLWPLAADEPTAKLSSPTYWPSDESYGYGLTTAAGASERSGQWWLYSFVPDRATNAVVLHEPNIPSGVSVDAAWQTTTGDPSVILSILDDGIDVSHPELLEALYLNVGELKQLPPRHADGAPCAPLDPTVPDSPPLDCSLPPDGLLTIADYKEELQWTGDGPGLDPNQNGVLDPADLLQLGYADHIDNDGNGLVDDISGWDFVDFDNLPAQTLTGSGTETALDAAAETNDDIGRAGVCPRCRILPVRVGFQRGSSPHALGLGLLYASSLGSIAASVGHLPNGRARLLDDAVRVAAERGMVTILPRDGEQQRTLPLRFNTEAARYIGSVGLLNNWTMKTGSFLAEDPCQTHEQEKTLFASAPACSRRGPGVALGILGLVASARRASPAKTKFTALELAETLAQTADTVTPSSAGSPAEAPAYRRLNAQRATLSAQLGTVPPTVLLEQPEWFETIVLGDLALSRDVVGTISAPDSGAFDVFVELAAGTAPLDGDYDTTFPVIENQSPTSPSGKLPLTTINYLQWYNSRAPKEATGMQATLRVRVVPRGERGTGETTTSAASLSYPHEAQVTRQVVLIKDSSLLLGFPYKLNAASNDPKLFDLDGDGAKEIVVGTNDGRLIALNQKSGEPVDQFSGTVTTRLLPAFERFRTLVSLDGKQVLPTLFGGPTPITLEEGAEPVVGAAASADLNSDGVPEVIFSGATGRIYAVQSDGTMLPGWPKCIQTGPAGDCQAANAIETGLASSPVLADVDGDGRKEIVVAGLDARLHAYERDGSTVLGWPIAVSTPEGDVTAPFITSPAVADLDGDQIDDIVLTATPPVTVSPAYASWTVAILGAAAPNVPQVAPGWPVTVESYDFQIDRFYRQTPAPAIDASTNAARSLLYGNETVPYFLPVRTGGTTEKRWLPRHAEPLQQDGETRGLALFDRGPDSDPPSPIRVAPLFARPVLADLDRDGETDVILPATTFETLSALRSTEETSHQAYLSFWSGRNGQMLAGSPIRLSDFAETAAPVIVDLNGDGYAEMILPGGDGTLVAYDACGRSPKGWPKVIGGRMSRSAAVGDVDGDKKLDVVAVTDDGRVFAWRTDADLDSHVPWGSALHDDSNTSAYRYPTATRPKFPGPIPLNPDGTCVRTEEDPGEVAAGPTLSAGGGCDCSVPKRPSFTREANVMLLVLLAFGAGRMRRNRDRSSES